MSCQEQIVFLYLLISLILYWDIKNFFPLESFEKNRSCFWTLTMRPAGIKIKVAYNLLLPALKGLTEPARKHCTLLLLPLWVFLYSNFT